MIRAVFDTNVFLRALINPHSRCGRLLAEFVEDFELAVSPAVVREILEVLHRPRLRAKFPQITQIDIRRSIVLFEQAVVVEPQDVPAICRDPDDDKFLACAVAAKADYIVTEDKDLLVLDSYKGIQICQPAEFVVFLEEKSASSRE